jgi:hypothetical protein
LWITGQSCGKTFVLVEAKTQQTVAGEGFRLRRILSVIASAKVQIGGKLS